MMLGSNKLATNVLGKKSGLNNVALILTEVISVAENVTKSVFKTIVETLSITEAFSSLKLYFKLLTENIGITETFNKGVVVTFIENIGVSETLTKVVGKILTEVLNITESFLETVKHVAHSLYGRITKSSKYHGIKKNNLSGKIKKL